MPCFLFWASGSLNRIVWGLTVASKGSYMGFRILVKGIYTKF